MPNLDSIVKTQKELNEAFSEHVKSNDERLKQIEEKGGADAVATERAEKALSQVVELNEKLTNLQKEFERSKAIDSLQGEKASEKTDRYGKFIKGAEYGDKTSLEYKKLFFSEKGKWDEEKSDEYVKAFTHYCRSGKSNFIDEVLAKQGIQAPDAKSMNIINDNAGGYLVSPVMGEMIVHTIQEFSPFHQYVDSMEIVADSIMFPTTNSQVGASRAHELGSRSESTAPTFGNVEIKPEDIYSKPHVSQRMLDLRPDMETWLSQVIADQFIITEADEMANGNAQGKCRGITTYAAGTGVGQIEQVNSGSAATIADADKIRDLQAALKAAYRTNARWYARRATFNVIGQLKDGNGRYLWQPGLQLGAPMNLLGHDVVEAEDMPALATNSLSLALADLLRAYKFVTMPGVRVLRDPYSSKPYVEMYTTRRSGGAVVVHEAVKLMKCST